MDDAGSVIGALALYGVGALIGRDRIRALVARLPLVKLADLDRTEAWFARHGGKAVFFGRMIPIFRSRFPEALLLADMKTMDGGGGEANAVFGGGANIIDFLALAGEATARAVCAARDRFREADPSIPRLAFADILLPMQGPARLAVEAAERMLAAGVDGVGVHLQYDAREADPALFESGYLNEVACAVFERVGARASVQAVGGLSVERAVALARRGLRAFVISGNLGLPDGKSRYGLPGDEIERHIRDFIDQVSAAG